MSRARLLRRPRRGYGNFKDQRDEHHALNLYPYLFPAKLNREYLGVLLLTSTTAIFKADVPAMPATDDLPFLNHSFAERKSQVGAQIFNRVDFSLPLEKRNADAVRLYAESKAFRHQLPKGRNTYPFLHRGDDIPGTIDIFLTARPAALRFRRTSRARQARCDFHVRRMRASSDLDHHPRFRACARSRVSCLCLRTRNRPPSTSRSLRGTESFRETLSFERQACGPDRTRESCGG